MSTHAEADGDALDSRTGWAIVAVGFLLLFVLWGAMFTFTVYSEALAGAFGLSPLRTSAVFSIGSAAFFLVGGTVGVLVSRVPLRPVVGAAALAIAAATGLLQIVDSFAGLVVAFSAFGAASGTVFVIVLSLVPQWFDEYEGRAMGLTVVGNGLGVQALPFVWLWLLERTTIRAAWLVVGGAGVALALVAALLFRRPAGRAAAAGGSAGWRWLGSLLSDVRFLAAWSGLVIAWAWYFVLSAGIVDILTSAGIARAVAATAFGLIGGVSVVSRVAAGGVADVVGARETLVTGVGLTAGGLFVLSIATTVPTMYLSVATFGAGLGAIAALYAPIVIAAFGPENATAVTGLFTYSSAVAGFVAPLGASVFASAVGGYGLPLATLGALTLVGAGLFYWGTAPSTAAGEREA